MKRWSLCFLAIVSACVAIPPPAAPTSGRFGAPTIPSQRRVQRFLDRPSQATDSRRQRVHRDFEFLGPTDQGLRDTVVLDQVGGASVPHLVAPSSPPTIRRRVRAVVVYPLNRVAGGTGAHVSQELGEVVSPFGAHRDAASAVVLKAFHGRQVTPVLDSPPRHVLARFGATSGRTVCRVLSSDFAAATTTADHLTIRQRIDVSRDTDAAAVTFVLPTPGSLSHDN